MSRKGNKKRKRRRKERNRERRQEIMGKGGEGALAARARAIREGKLDSFVLKDRAGSDTTLELDFDFDTPHIGGLEALKQLRSGSD